MPLNTPRYDPSSQKESECSVSVAVHIRPIIHKEQVQGCQTAFRVFDGMHVVTPNNNSFTYDHVFGSCSGALPSHLLYEKTIQPLVNDLFNGYNTTVLAYGQTGSGKTFTMGTGIKCGGNENGVAPKVMDALYERIQQENKASGSSYATNSQNVSFTVRVQFVEIHKEDIRDLLLVDPDDSNSICVREIPSGGVYVAGATDVQVHSKQEMLSLLEQGTLSRATAATEMNSRSSRSHAIYTITLEQRRSNTSKDKNYEQNSSKELFLTAKMHLVDLAGSERAKRTKAEGILLREGIHINKGLLSLGKCINALSNYEQKRSNGPNSSPGFCHVPYRESKLTRLLQDSLGGNSRTVMIACISPADINMEESVSTLKYAARARNIKNKLVKNVDPIAAELDQLRQSLAAAKAEIQRLKMASKQHNTNDDIEIEAKNKGRNDSHHESSLLNEIQRLKVQVNHHQKEVLEMSNREEIAKLEVTLDELRKQGIKANSFDDDKENHLFIDEFPKKNHTKSKFDICIARIAHLEAENEMLKNKATQCFKDENESSSDQDEEDAEADWQETEEPDIEKLKLKMIVLQRELISKEDQMNRVGNESGRIGILKRQYEKVLEDLENERCKLQSEKLKLIENIKKLEESASSERQKERERYSLRLQELEEKLQELRIRLKKHDEMQKLLHRSEAARMRLEKDIQNIKTKMVQLTSQFEKEAKKHAVWKKIHEKQIADLKRQGLKDALKVQQLEDLRMRQNLVVKRKTEEAEAARKRLNDILNSTRQKIRTFPIVFTRNEKQRREWLEHELDVSLQAHDIKKVIEDEAQKRTHCVKALKALENQHTISEEEKIMIESYKGQINQYGHKIKQLQTQLLESTRENDYSVEDMSQEGRETAIMEMERWDSLRTLGEAKVMLRTLFRLAKKALLESRNLATLSASLKSARRMIKHYRKLLQSTERSKLNKENKEKNSLSEDEVNDLLNEMSKMTTQQLDSSQEMIAQLNSSRDEMIAQLDSSRDEMAAQLDSSRDEMAVHLNEIDLLPRKSGQSRNDGSENKMHNTCMSDNWSDEEYVESEQEMDDPSWHISNAIPTRERKFRSKSRADNVGNQASQNLTRNRRLPGNAGGGGGGGGHLRLIEHSILKNINAERGESGLEPISKLTNQILKNHLKGKTVNGKTTKTSNQDWHSLINQYCDVLGLYLGSSEPQHSYG